MKYFFMLFFSVVFLGASAQSDTTLLILDDLQVDVQSAEVDGDTAMVNLFFISTSTMPREFKMNTFASVVVDANDDDHLYSQIVMGRVNIDIEDRQNYLQYLLEQDVPVPIQFKVWNWKNEYGVPIAVKIVFEDSQEFGKFRELRVPLNLSR